MSELDFSKLRSVVAKVFNELQQNPASFSAFQENFDERTTFPDWKPPEINCLTTAYIDMATKDFSGIPLSTTEAFERFATSFIECITSEG